MTIGTTVEPSHSLARFRPYAEYKDSGMEWLGKIPVPWRVLPLKRLCSRSALYGANVPAESYVLAGVRFLRTTDITDEGALAPEGVYVPLADVGEYLLRSGDLLFSRSGTIGRSLLYDELRHGPCAYAGYLVRFVPHRGLLPRYAFYFSKTRQFADWLSVSVVSSTIGNVNGQKYANLPVPFPPFAEQRAIAAFLDHETAKIDTLVAKKDRLIELLQEQRTAFISHAVTKGLDPNVPLKDSGVEWLGEIPVHWEVRRLKHLSTVDDEALSEDTDPELEIAYIDIGNVDASVGVGSKDRYFFANAPSRARKVVRHGDVIVSTVRTYLRAIAPITNPEPNLIVSTGFAVVRPRHLDPSFTAYALRAPYFVDRVVADSVGVSYPAINPTQMACFPLAYPALEEQRAELFVEAALDEEPGERGVAQRELPA